MGGWVGGWVAGWLAGWRLPCLVLRGCEWQGLACQLLLSLACAHTHPHARTHTHTDSHTHTHTQAHTHHVCPCVSTAQAGFDYIPLLRNVVRFIVQVLLYWQKFFYWSVPP